MKDVDAAQRAFKARILALALAGGIIGAFGGGFAVSQSGGSPGQLLVGAVVGYGVAVATIYFGALAVVEVSGSLAHRLYAPSGRSTPSRPGYSKADSLAARARYEEAAAAYARGAEENPRDPEPRLRLARLLRDELDRPEEAAEWLDRARSVADATPGTVRIATREIVEIHERRRPKRAISELVGLARRFPDTPDAAWAKKRVRAIKRALAEEPERADGEPPT